MSAVAEQLTDTELDRGLELFSRASLAQGMREWSLGDVRSPARHRLYRATASEHFVLGERDQRMSVRRFHGPDDGLQRDHLEVRNPDRRRGNVGEHSRRASSTPAWDEPAGHVGGEMCLTMFDACFRPASEKVRRRWERVALAHRTGTALPPITVLERPDGYYVVDGRHRVSVARALGHRDIDAWVRPLAMLAREMAA